MEDSNRLDFVPEEIDDLFDRLKNKCLIENDYVLLAKIMKAMAWISFSMREKKLTIKQLRAIFSIKTGSAKKLLELVQGDSAEQLLQGSKIKSQG